VIPLTVSSASASRGSARSLSVREGTRSLFNAQVRHSAQSYVSRLATRASLYSDLQTLLSIVHEPVPRAEYRRLVIEENVLSRRSSVAREKAWNELAVRYGMDGSSPLFRAYLEEYRRGSSERDRALTSYILFALHDRLVCDLGTDWLYEYLRAAPADLRTVDVLAFLSSREASHTEIRGWSALTRENIASHYLSALKEFGLARGSQRKMSMRPSPGPAAIRFLLRAVLLAGASQKEAVQSRLLRLLGFTLEETVSLLFLLNAEGALRCHIQGDVVDIEFGDCNGT